MHQGMDYRKEGRKRVGVTRFRKSYEMMTSKNRIGNTVLYTGVWISCEIGIQPTWNTVTSYQCISNKTRLLSKRQTKKKDV